MFPRFADVITAINDLKTLGVIDEYAIGGAVAQVFWDEAIPTFDLDVFIVLKGGDSPFISLEPIYTWAAERKYELRYEHIVISGVPVQFLPAHNALAEEAVRAAKTLDFEQVTMRVVTPEYLVALWSQPPANTARRRERAAKLRESVQMDETVLNDIMERYGLKS